AAHLREILRIRSSSPLFRLRSEAEAEARVSFYNAGDSPQDALIVMKLSDAPEPDLDPAYETLLVFFNAHKIAQGYTIPEAAGLGFQLHPVQADAVDEDPVVKTATFDDGSGQFTIPARTTAVFVSTQVLASPSSLDWVGLMWPRGGVSHEVAAGGAGGDFQVYVQVYEPGVTDLAGQGAGITCFLHWGRYGGAWQDLAMTYNVDQGNNDEYVATIPQATLNGLAPGTYGFTAYCSEDGGASQKWKQDGDDLDGDPGTNTPEDKDVGDGILSITPADDASPAPGGGVSVHLFEWKWTDIAQECPYLAGKGYDAVQISPPSDHIDDAAWWARYQPVSYDLTSRSGTPAEFDAMVAACNSAGVAVYADA
ncbi:MAG: alpha-1,6-glucosidase domain-containing protein, partial [Anaerolineae bacterium]